MGSDLSLTAAGPELALIAELAGIELPSAPFRVEGRVERTSERAGGRGLVGIQERGELLGGSLSIGSSPQSGTRLDVSLSMSCINPARICVSPFLSRRMVSAWRVPSG